MGQEHRIVIYGLGTIFHRYEYLFRSAKGCIFFCDRNEAKVAQFENGISFADLKAHVFEFDEIVITMMDMMQAVAAMEAIGAAAEKYRNVWQFFKEQRLDVMDSRYHGEETIDAVIESVLLRMGKDPSHIHYIEIGTNHPTEGNNTYHFYELGARGILVDPLPQSETLSCLWRPEDKFLRAAVSAIHRGGTIDFYIDTDVASGISSIHAGHYKMWGGKPPVRVQVPCITITHLLETAGFVPDVLLIDAEGEDENILRSIRLDVYPIPIICIEVCNMSMESYFQMVAYMNECGYEIYTTSPRRVNSVFVRRH